MEANDSYTLGGLPCPFLSIVTARQTEFPCHYYYYYYLNICLAGFGGYLAVLFSKDNTCCWTVCLDIKMGGLGIKSLAILNKALLCKWIWRFANERDSRWRNVILWKFGEERGGCLWFWGLEGD